jgi:hypothetical protein
MNIKPLILFLQDAVGPVSACILIVYTFFLDVWESVDNPWVKAGIIIYVICMAGFYFARMRKVWKEGTYIGKQTQHYSKQKSYYYDEEK